MSSIIEVCNLGLAQLGDEFIEDFIDLTINRVKLCNLYYPKVSDAVLRAYPWNCATDRIGLELHTYAPKFRYTHRFSLPLEEADVTLEAETIAFVDGGDEADTITDSDEGFVDAGFKEGREITVEGGLNDGKTFKIETVEAGTLTLVDEDEVVEEEEGEETTITSPAIYCLRVLEIDDKGASWRREGNYLCCNNNAVDIRFVKRISTEYFDPLLVQAVAMRLAFHLSKPIIGTTQMDLWVAYQKVLEEARTIDGMEGILDSYSSNILIDVR